MIPFFIPLLADASMATTKIFNENYYESVRDYAITRLYDNESLKLNSDTLKVFSHESISTFIDFNNELDSNSETWNDMLEQDFDIVSKFNFKSSIKLKVKIKSITKFTPNIVLE